MYANESIRPALQPPLRISWLVRLALLVALMPGNLLWTAPARSDDEPKKSAEPTEPAKPAVRAEDAPADSDAKQPAEAATDNNPQPQPPADAETPSAKPASRSSFVPPNLPGRKMQNVKEFLELIGVDASHWRNFYQDRPFEKADEEYVNRILVLMPRVGRDLMYRYSRHDWQPQPLLDTPREFQGETYCLRGRATKIVKAPLVEELHERFGFTHHYQVTIEVKEPAVTAVVCVAQIPFAWPDGGEIDEPVEVEGLFVKLSPQADNTTRFIFVSDHIDWRPARLDVKNGITPEILRLVECGFDASTLPDIRGKKIGPLAEAENEAFYQMQAAVHQLPHDDPLLARPQKLDIMSCLARPEEQFGKVVTCLGNVRRIERIEIPEGRGIHTRFGIDHYFVLYLLMPLENERIKWERSAHDPAPRIFDNFFPVTVCTRELPPGVAPSPDAHLPLRVKGVMFKVWSYTPQGEGKDLPQPSPLLFAATVEELPPIVPSNSFSNLVLFLIVLGAGGLFWLAFSLGSGAARSSRNSIPAHIALAPENPPGSTSDEPASLIHPVDEGSPPATELPHASSAPDPASDSPSASAAE